MIRIHGTCIAIDRVGVLIRGRSGAGKSDLALRLIDQGAHLVADDQVLLVPDHGRLVATCPSAIAGRLEVRGLGIVPVPSIPSAAIGLVIDLADPSILERLPERRRCTLADIELPLVVLAPFEVSAAAKVRLAVGTLGSDIIGAC